MGQIRDICGYDLKKS